ncbi:hypothetical protein [Persephonella sp.]
MRYILVLILLIFVSCAPIKKKITCEDRFHAVLKSQTKKKKSFKVTGTIFTGGIFFIFNGKFNEEDKVNIFTPLGQKVLSIKYKNNELCLVEKNEEMCGIDTDIFKEYIKSEIPFDLKSLLTGKFDLSKDNRYICKNDRLIVDAGKFSIIFKGTRPVKLIYKDYFAQYRYELNRIKSIYILKKDREEEILKIYIKSIKWL